MLRGSKMGVLTKPLIVFIGSCGISGGIIWFVHYNEERNIKRMKQNVYNDIAEELRTKYENDQLEKNNGKCESGICDLKTSRIIEN